MTVLQMRSPCSLRASAANLTFWHLAWNAPFYARLGFVRLDEDELTTTLSPSLQSEAELGLINRIAMKYKLT